MVVYLTREIPYDGEIISGLFPATLMTPMEGLSDKRRVFSVAEILQKHFTEDFEKAIQRYAEVCPEGMAAQDGFEGTSHHRI